MKVLHISTHQTGGAALAAFRLHRSLIDNGVESRMLTLDGDCDDNLVVRYKPIFDFHSSRILKSTLYRLGIGIGHYWRMHDKARKGHECQYTYPVSLYRVERNPLVKWADIIHLHFCDDFINYPTFFKKIKKPIVWTLHDIGIGYGGFHYRDDYNALLPYFESIEKEFCRIKCETLSIVNNLSIVSLSQEMYNFTKTIEYIADKPNRIIYNSVDTNTFVMKDRLKSREKLHLPQDKTILLFICENVHTKSKGLEVLKECIESFDKQDIMLCVVGNYNLEITKKDRINTIYFGKITDYELLSSIYSAANYLVVPSSQEVCPQTPLESMSCGTPIVVFPTGAMKEYVHPEQGVVCRDCSLLALRDGLIKAMQQHYDRKAIREYVYNNFSPTIIANMYIDFYESILKQ